MRAGGRQYRIEPDQLLDVDLLSADVGSTVELSDVLLLAGNGDVRVGTPTLADVRVIAEVVEHGRGKKILVYKQKSKTRYRRKKGHRQGYTRLAIRQIVAEEATIETAKPKATAQPKATAEAEQPQPKPPTRRTRRAPEPKDSAEASVELPVAEGSTPEPAAEAKPARRTRARKSPEGEKPDTSIKSDEKAESD